MTSMFQSLFAGWVVGAATRAETQALCHTHSRCGAILIERLRKWRLRRQERAELEVMSDRELADFGFRRGHLPALLRGRTTNGSLDRMLTRLGLHDHPYLTDQAFRRTLERSCIVCPATGACRRWMSRPDPAGGYRRFCPNAFEFDSMARAAARQSPQETDSLSH